MKSKGIPSHPILSHFASIKEFFRNPLKLIQYPILLTTKRAESVHFTEDIEMGNVCINSEEMTATESFGFVQNPKAYGFAF